MKTTKKIRYPGAQPFSTEQQSIFFGRERELDELHRFVLAEQLVVLYAKSGLGKSSLLNAGLVPLVREEGRLEPLNIRFGAYAGDRPDGPLESAAAGLSEGIKTTAPALEKIRPEGEDSLWYRLKTRQLLRLDQGYLLLFDQFEELFTYPEEAVQAFGRQLSELLYTTIPDRFRERLETGLQGDDAFLSDDEMQRLHRPFELRIVLAIRSDRMSLLNKLKTFLPNILENCYELRALTVEEAESAILSPAYLPQERGPFASPVFDYEDEAVAGLIDFLSEGRTQEIESFQLQILCEYAERQVVLKQGRTLVAQSDLADPESILENYYLGKIAELPEADRLPARRLIEEGLVFEEEERRLTLYEGQINRTYGIGPELLRTLLDSHLIRSEPSLRGGYTYELSHDTLVAPVLRAKTKRLEEERLEAEKEAQRQKEAELAELRRQAEEERQRAEEEKQLREAAENNEQRARQRTRLAAAISLVALALAFLAGWSYRQADKAKNEATTQREEALRQKTEAELARAAADSSAEIAVQRTREAEAALQLADDNLRKAQVEEAKARAALEQVEKEKAATEEQRRLAEGNARIAEDRRAEAESLRDQAEQALDKATQERMRADAEREIAQKALANLESANAATVDLLLANADREVYNLRYEAALQTIKAAAGLGARRPEVAEALLEIAFWHGEKGDTARAWGLLHSVAVLADRPVDKALPIRRAVEAFDAEAYERLMRRYYPLELADVPGGEFLMGCDTTLEQYCRDDEKLHLQEVSSFQIARYETTWWEYYLFCQATGHAYESPGWGTDGDNPAVNVSWFDAVLYLNWLSKQHGKDTVYIVENKREGTFRDYYDVRLRPGARGYRLPTEAEWEYAAKGGVNRSPYIYSGGNELDSVGWYWENSELNGVNRTHPVGELRANELDLFDMSGNAYEWCGDWYDDYPAAPGKDYLGPETGSYRVIRGGSWYDDAEYCRTAFRNNFRDPDYRSNDIGFRLVFVP